MTWVTVAETSDIGPGEKRCYDIGGSEIVVVNIDDEYFAFQSFCPHMAGPLGRGPIDESKKTVSCPIHDWKFDLETGDPLFPAKERIPTYETDVEENNIKIKL